MKKVASILLGIFVLVCVLVPINKPKHYDFEHPFKIELLCMTLTKGEAQAKLERGIKSLGEANILSEEFHHESDGDFWVGKAEVEISGSEFDTLHANPPAETKPKPQSL